VRGSVALSALIVLVIALTSPLAGSSHISLTKAFEGISPDHEIFFYARLPRVLLAVLAGSALSITGVMFQCMLRDPLAEPYTLGVSSGASVGAVLAISLGIPYISIAGLAGAAIVLLIVVAMSVEGRRVSSFTLLLTGVTMNSIAFAAILFMHSIASLSQSFAISRWLMGGLDAVPYSTVGWLAAVLLPLMVIVTLQAPQWNLLAVGEEWAASRGISTTRLTLFGYIAGSVLTGLVTAITGPIGFVGLIVPHALRLKLGADHRILMPCAILIGAAFLAICDTIARTIVPPTDIPVGVLTAMGGGPFFLWLLRSKRRHFWT
jgi:iron complex transport system permease protein